MFATTTKYGTCLFQVPQGIQVRVPLAAGRNMAAVWRKGTGARWPYDVSAHEHVRGHQVHIRWLWEERFDDADDDWEYRGE